MSKTAIVEGKTYTYVEDVGWVCDDCNAFGGDPRRIHHYDGCGGEHLMDPEKELRIDILGEEDIDEEEY